MVVPTRDRGARILPALRAILSDPDCRLEVIVIDQSSTDATNVALTADGLLADDRVVYQRSSTVGLSNARNEGIGCARAPIVAFTDDDCVAGTSWGNRVLERFHELPDMSILYADVIPGPERAEGWIPEFETLQEGPVPPVAGMVVRRLGLGANMAVRRSSLARLRGFDRLLGAGTRFASGEDTDFGYRALRAGLSVYTFHEPHVVHHGLRTGREQISASGSGYLQGMAAFCMKQVRCGDIVMVRPPLRELGSLLVTGARSLVVTHRPSGWRGAVSIVAGSAGSWLYGVDRRQRLYRRRHVTQPERVDATVQTPQ